MMLGEEKNRRERRKNLPFPGSQDSRLRFLVIRSLERCRN